MDIPRYPDSRPLELADKPRFDGVFGAHPPEISEFTFTNLYAWRKAYAFRVSLLDDSLILTAKIRQSLSFLDPLGGDLGACVARLSREKIPFIRIPEKDVGVIAAASGFHAQADPDNADYVYSVKELVELKGKRFDGKRNFLKKFKRNYAYEYVRLDDNAVRECLDFEDIWCITKGCENEDGLTAERDAVRDMCHNFSSFGLFGGGISVGGKMCAVAIGQRLNADTLVMHVLKAMPDMPGIYQTMHNEFLSREAGGYTYVNMEQDLGVEGLRKSKLSYQPVRMTQKFILSPG